MERRANPVYMSGAMEAAAHPRGLSIAEAERKLSALGPVESDSSRSVRSIVIGNVFTLFNAIIFVFFVLVLSLGLFADALFGLIAAVNSYIGIRQELKAKQTLDELALLVAPSAKTVRDDRMLELRADEVVPGDVVRVEPGDQLVADGEVISSRGLTVDESLLTGEADGIRKQTGDRLLSGSFASSGSGYYELDAVREDSYAEKLAGEAREFRHPPSPLQEEINRILWATTILLVPLAIVLIVSLSLRDTDFKEAAQTATAGLITLIPEGLVLLMSVTFAVAAVRLAKRRTLVQQISATEALAAVDTICIDKTGTLTDGSLELVGIEPADPSRADEAERALASFAASAGERNRTLQTIAERYPGRAEPVTAEVPFSSDWKWSGVTLDGGGPARSYVLGAPDVLTESGALTLPPASSRRSKSTRSQGRRVVAFGEARGGLPADPAREAPPRLEPHALIVLSETLRPDATEAIQFMREQEVDLKLISGDARETVTAVAAAVGVPPGAGVIEGSALPADEAALGEVAERNTIFCRIRPEQKKALVAALTDRGRMTAMIGDGVNDVPALKQARLAVAMGSGSQISKGVSDIVLLDDQFSMLPRAVAEGRRIARNIHRLARLYLTKTVYAAFLIATEAIFAFTFPFLPRHLTLAAFLTIGVPSFVLALAPSEGPLYRGRLLTRDRRLRGPSGRRDRDRLPALVLLRRHDLRRHDRGRPHRCDDDADRARALLHPAARARAGTRAHRDPELHARDGRGARRALRAGDRGDARARVLRARDPLRRPVVPVPARGRRGARDRGGGVAAATDPATRERGGGRLPGCAFADPSTADFRPARGTRSHVRKRSMSGVYDTQPAMPLPSGSGQRTEHRRTKIVATVGPATRDPGRLWGLISAGVDVLRLNFSHGTREEHAENIERIRAASDAVGKQVGILGDLPGPKIRLDDFGHDVVVLHSGDEMSLTTREGEGSRKSLPVAWDGLPGAVSPGDHIYLADGRVRLRAVDVTEDEVHCEVEAGGAVASHQGINLPGAATALPAAGADDLDWVDFAVDHGIDLLAVSFVRSAADLEPVMERLAERDCDIPLIAKIEKPQAAENAEEIVQAAGSGIMVARGDLGIELPLSKVPAVQKHLIKLAGQHSKPSVTATQMLASMTATPRPTRAEVTDVANAIYDGTDAVMLSEETAVGEHPIEAVRVMDQIARETEKDLPYEEWLDHRTERRSDEIGNSVAHGAVARDLQPRPRRARRADPQRPHRPPRLGLPPEGPGARDHPADRDGAPAQPPLRRPVPSYRRTGRACGCCSTSARSPPARPASPSSAT